MNVMCLLVLMCSITAPTVLDASHYDPLLKKASECRIHLLKKLCKNKSAESKQVITILLADDTVANSKNVLGETLLQELIRLREAGLVAQLLSMGNADVNYVNPTNKLSVHAYGQLYGTPHIMRSLNAYHAKAAGAFDKRIAEGKRNIKQHLAGRVPHNE